MKYALGKGSDFHLDSLSNNLLIYQKSGEKLIKRTLQQTISSATYEFFGDESYNLHDGKILLRKNKKFTIC